ncbi:poly-beta-1,6-N-acetyl-D-glucosamine biosynthesis protein PgaD [Marilutibacter maris]|uniref:Hemin storage protein n=1 Tax=Marilutibacter maris TaxID=1605891 RepID=A0A2U9T515_9GAMM|nr:poly-beta-1,6-N-acetyl-D-glucosamine biosynthesis protein PgaD [Lysobacter maris]AWV07611.1 hemin storage protein [Lysobacter maris]
MKYDSLLIEKPRSRPLAVRTVWGLVTAACWLVYAYLWLPVVTLLLWTLGLRVAAFELYLRNDSVDPLLLILLPLLAVAAAVALIGWAEINRRRFANKERRAPTPNVGAQDVGRALGAAAHLPERLQSAKVVTLRMDDDARPYDLAPVPRPTPAAPIPPKQTERSGS